MIFVHDTLRRLRGHLAAAAAAAAVIFVVATAIAWAHSGPGMDHMEMSGVVSVCLAVGGVASATLAGAAAPGWLHRLLVSEVSLHRQLPLPKPAIRARDGPALLQVFRI